jgi:hypothetical protein
MRCKPVATQPRVRSFDTLSTISWGRISTVLGSERCIVCVRALWELRSTETVWALGQNA